jgi:uncharacterized damage-inducible protein DinB
MPKPQPHEYASFNPAYIANVGDNDVISALENQLAITCNLFSTLPPGKADYAYDTGKWTLKEVLGHMADTERIMSYRLLRFARNDGAELRGFNENDYVANARFATREMSDLLEEYVLVRKANLHLFKSLNDDEKQRSGIANGKPVTVNALLYVIAGHELHHIDIIKQRYL